MLQYIISHPSESQAIFAFIQLIMAILAFIGASVWFLKRRLHLPMANIDQKVEYRKISDNEYLLRVILILENKGNIRINIRSGFARVHTLNPFPADIYNLYRQNEDYTQDGWVNLPDFKRRDIKFDMMPIVEAGETQELYFDFILETSVRSVIVHTSITNEATNIADYGDLLYKFDPKAMSWSIERIYTPDLDPKKELADELSKLCEALRADRSGKTDTGKV